MKAIFVLLLAILCSTQGTIQVRELINSANEAARSGNAEQAASSLVVACEMIRGYKDKKVRSLLLRRTEPALKKIDPLHAFAVSTRRGTAKKLRLLARKYSKTGWHRMAQSLVNLADHVNPSRATTPRLSAGNREIEHDAAALFKVSKVEESKDRWTIKKEGIQSPLVQAGDSSLLIFDVAPISKWMLSSRVQLPRGSLGFGFVFAYIDANHHYILDLESNGKELIVRLDKVETEEILECYAMSCTIQDSWRTIGISIRLRKEGDYIRFSVGNLQPRVIQIGPEGSAGKLGLSSAGDRPSIDPLLFKDLKLIEN